MPRYGGFWIRVLAYIIDAIVVDLAMGFVGALVGGVIGMGSPQAMIATIQLVSSMLGLLGSWLYFAIMESSPWQATLGKKALGLVVTDESGQRIGFGRATGRYFAKILSAMILLFGFFMVGWTQRKQGLHDLVAGTLVYKARDPAELGVPADVFS